MGYDIIGDVHGHADKLEELLLQLGYAVRNGAWRHPSRTAIFVGDLIDRGPGQLRTLRLVRAMVDAGSAEMVMGNHEFNAIGWATEDAANPGAHLRARGNKNRRQHQAFLSEVGADSREHMEWVAWFMSLPLWIEHSEFRVVHACWDPAAVQTLAPHLKDGRFLTEEILRAAYDRDHVISKAIDVLLKGPEVVLPGGAWFEDKDGHVRHEIRTRWWSDAATYREAYIGPDGVDVPDLPLPQTNRIPEPDRPTFIGHYWLDPSHPPEPLARRVVCVDYSVAKGGPLASFRFDEGVAFSHHGFTATSN